ncbi:uncharacterized protein LOC122400851 [Colletes gigas]|uniref:uncharacterized protein LOC122400851 n=1 Tax=Colletes gigas TaxID=935657 RepID=UPI001C9B0F31|nr:uncharacterized protein LOC122400851 [Colletes gigas]
MSREEKLCELSFQDTTQRDSSGHFMVRLPFNDRRGELGDSYESALKRFYAMERKLQLNTELREKYVDFLEEYQRLGHMTEVTNVAAKNSGCYLPHHAVVKDSSLTMKVRVVFDASAKTNTGISLNDTLMVGPTIQEDIFALITRFRSHVYVLTADVEKMFRQIRLHPDDAIYHQILWRKNPTEAIKTYQLNTVTYGTACAPFLAVRCLNQLTSDSEKSFPLATNAIKRDFYMDDLLTGTQTLNEAIALRDQLVEALKTGGFNLRQWASNEPSLIANFKELASEEFLFLDMETVKKTLGIYWRPRDDSISYKVTITDQGSQITKRTIFSNIAKLFDPLGLLGPVVVKAKLIMQELWKRGVGWDNTAPSDILSLWNIYMSQLPVLNNFVVPRQIIGNNTLECRLHGFCDASETAYGACIYLRCTDAKKGTTTNLIAAKSRVAPLKTITIPKLELCAAELLMLGWLNSPPHTLETFIANRVAKVQERTNAKDWKHVASSDNPADCISRGQLPLEFLENHLWLNGPVWLSELPSKWPIIPIPVKDIQELRVTLLESNTGPLSVFELRRAQDSIITNIQRTHFTREFQELNTKGMVSKTSKLYALSPFIEHGIIRVGGRLQNSNIRYSQKHPILLPKSNHVSYLIIRNEHHRCMHAGILGTLNAVRQRVNPQSTPEYSMGKLPKDRVNSARPFQIVGIDFCGPFYIKEKKFRNTKKLKVWIAVFICFVTKAMHLEVVSDLSTDAFIASLRRFFSRRGYAHTIYSDNGTNFVGARNKLTEMEELLRSEEHRHVAIKYLTDKGITWHFSPPRSPHYGGLWEAAVKSFKYHLLRTIGDILFTYEELNTYVVEIEAILNSRPITPISSDPNDYIALTPAHFLIGESLIGLPEQDVSAIANN